MNLLYAFLLALLALTSCQRKDSNRKDKASCKNEPVLNITISCEVRSLDPRVGVDFPSVHIIKMLFEGLMTLGPDGKIRHGLAKEVKISEDHKTYTFYLRPSTWSNGTRVTAYDFEYAWKKVVDPRQGSLGVQNFYPIKNVRAIVLGEKPLESVGIKALDAHRLQVELEHPSPYFLELVAQSSFLPVSVTWDQSCPNWPSLCGDGFVCNGPYLLTKHSIENEIHVKKNPSYWDAKNVHMPEIHIAIIKDAMTQLNLYEKKKLQWIGGPLSKLPIDAIGTLKKQKKVEFAESLGITWIFVNTEAFPFNNVKMRKAFAYAINRKNIASYILQCNECPATGVLPYSIATQNAPFFSDGDTALAQALFNEALEEMGLKKEDLPEIVLNFAATSANSSVMQSIQEQWNKTLGIEVKLENQEWKAHFSKVQKGNYQLGAMGWQSWLRDPIYIMQTFRDKSDGLNMSRWENSQYKEFLNLAESEYEAEKRKHYFNLAEALLMEEMPVIPLYFGTFSFCKDPSLKNVVISDLYEIDYRWSEFEELAAVR